MGGVRAADPSAAIVGREAELDAVARAFASGARLVTLTGLGGVGKTTIAAAYSARAADAPSPEQRADVAPTFVDLASVTDVADVLPAIGRALGVSGADSDDLETVVTRAIRRTTGLVVLDNFEHVLAARGIVARLLDRVGTDVAF